MKKITINDLVFWYQICTDIGEWGDFQKTEFYSNTEVIETSRKKYLLFGKTIYTLKPKKLFELYFSIEDCKYTAGTVRKEIERNIELLNRAEEIKKGNII